MEFRMADGTVMSADEWSGQQAGEVAPEVAPEAAPDEAAPQEAAAATEGDGDEAEA
jgi:hypothetical protein